MWNGAARSWLRLRMISGNRGASLTAEARKQTMHKKHSASGSGSWTQPLPRPGKRLWPRSKG